MRMREEVACSRLGGLLVVKVRGVVDVDGMVLVRVRTRLELVREPASAVVVDMRQAVHAFSTQDWVRSVLDEAAAGIRTSIPLAMLVAPGVANQAADYCMQVAAFGLPRASFMEWEDAVFWALERASRPHQQPRQRA
jgi:hypothetical protein